MRLEMVARRFSGYEDWRQEAAGWMVLHNPSLMLFDMLVIQAADTSKGLRKQRECPHAQSVRSSGESKVPMTYLTDLYLGSLRSRSTETRLDDMQGSGRAERAPLGTQDIQIGHCCTNQHVLSVELRFHSCAAFKTKKPFYYRDSRYHTLTTLLSPNRLDSLALPHATLDSLDKRLAQDYLRTVCAFPEIAHREGLRKGSPWKMGNRYVDLCRVRL